MKFFSHRLLKKNFQKIKRELLLVFKAEQLLYMLLKILNLLNLKIDGKTDGETDEEFAKEKNILSLFS